MYYDDLMLLLIVVKMLTFFHTSTLQKALFVAYINAHASTLEAHGKHPCLISHGERRQEPTLPLERCFASYVNIIMSIFATIHNLLSVQRRHALI